MWGFIEHFKHRGFVHIEGLMLNVKAFQMFNL